MTQPPSQNRLAHSISVDNQTDIAPKLSHSMSVGSALSAQRQLNEWANTLQPVRDGQEVMSDWADYSSAQSRSVHSSLHFTSTAAESGDEFTRVCDACYFCRFFSLIAISQLLICNNVLGLN